MCEEPLLPSWKAGLAVADRREEVLTALKE